MKSELIISADDFGLRPEANRRILSLLREGCLDRVAVMTDGTVSRDEVSELVRSGAALDIHLDFDTSASAKKEVAEGVCKRGMFFVLGWLSGRMRPSVIRREWERQIDAFEVMFGRVPDGLNSHEYLHLFPPYFSVAVDLAIRRGIPYIRFGSVGLAEGGNPVSMILRTLHLLDRRRFADSGLRSSTFMTSLDWASDPDTAVFDADTELVAHPEREREYDSIRRIRRRRTDDPDIS